MLLQKIKSFIILLSSSLNFLFFQFKKKRDFVFFSESHNYKFNYIDLLNNLNKKPYVTSLITSDINEYSDLKKDNYDVYYIGKGFFRTVIFNFLNCKYMILTMTDLGNNLNKSLFCENYVYFFHCMHSTHKIYTPKAFDNYDIIFSVGVFQSDEIKKNEIINNLKKKKIYETGYFYLDYLVKNSNKSIVEKNCILFAPSWNYDEDSLFNKYADSIINNLINSGFNVIFRPHPEIIKRNKNQYDYIVNKFGISKNFILDVSPSNIQSMEKASLLITDNSSISIEYSFAFYRPVIFIDYKEKIHNKNYQSISNSTFESEFKKEIALSVPIKDINKLNLICENTINNYKFDNHKIDIFKKNFLSNISKSSEVAAHFLINDDN
jgi:hypothetical protein